MYDDDWMPGGSYNPGTTEDIVNDLSLDDDDTYDDDDVEDEEEYEEEYEDEDDDTYDDMEVEDYDDNDDEEEEVDNSLLGGCNVCDVDYPEVRGFVLSSAQVQAREAARAAAPDHHNDCEDPVTQGARGFANQQPQQSAHNHSCCQTHCSPGENRRVVNPLPDTGFLRYR